MNARTIIGIVGIGAAAALGVGCEDRNEPTATPRTETTTGADVRREVDQAAGAVSDYTAEKRDAFVAAAQKQVDALEEELASLAAEADAKGDAVKARFADMRESLERELRVAEDRLEAARDASAEAWTEVKNGFTVAAEDAKAALAKARTTLFGAPAPQTPPSQNPPPRD